MAKVFSLSSILVFSLSVWALSPTAVWRVTNKIEAPESVYFDQQSGLVFVSNIAGQGIEKDGRGWIQILDKNGRIVHAQWPSGVTLNAPKGMRAQNGVLWVTDIDRVVAIDIQSGRQVREVAIAGAKFLNDVAIAIDGEVFVSDTIGRTIYRIPTGGLPKVFLSGDITESPNGLLIKDGKLIVAAWGLAADDWSTVVAGRIYEIDLISKAKKVITRAPLGNLDGLEVAKDGSYLVSDWKSGAIYSVKPTGEITKIAIAPVSGAADIGFIPELNRLVVPYMNDNRVEAFDLN
jgi:sugar lactone lactonase YvrE